MEDGGGLAAARVHQTEEDSWNLLRPLPVSLRHIMRHFLYIDLGFIRIYNVPRKEQNFIFIPAFWRVFLGDLTEERILVPGFTILTNYISVVDI